jgi:hypothetical protein
MFKHSILPVLLLLSAPALFGQQLNTDDYKIYSALIKTEIRDTTKSVAIIKTGIGYQEIKDNLLSIVDAFMSNDSSLIVEVRGWTENNNGNRPTFIDSASQVFVVDYSENKYADFVLTEQLSLNAQIFWLKSFPVKTKSTDKDWKDFYKKYPGSGGIFSLSRVMYSPDEMTAIFYYWHRMNGLNGHGALAIMEKIGGDWKIKYKTYLAWN